MKPEDFPSLSAYLRAVKEKHGSKVTLTAMQGRYAKGIRDEKTLVAPIMSRSFTAKMGKKKSPWNSASSPIERK